MSDEFEAYNNRNNEPEEREPMYTGEELEGLSEVEKEEYKRLANKAQSFLHKSVQEKNRLTAEAWVNKKCQEHIAQWGSISPYHVEQYKRESRAKFPDNPVW